MPTPVSVTAIRTKSPETPSAAIRALIADADAQPSAFRHGVARIHRNVEHGQFKFVEVDLDRPHVIGDVGDDLDVAAQRCPQQFDQLGREGAEIENLRL